MNLYIGEGNGTPLQCSCLENPRDGGAWWAAVYGVTQSRTGLKRLSSSSRISIYSGLAIAVGRFQGLVIKILFKEVFTCWIDHVLSHNRLWCVVMLSFRLQCFLVIFILPLSVLHISIRNRGLPRWLSGKESACSAGDASSICGSRISPREGMATHSTQYSWLENLMDRGAWQAARGFQSQTHVTEHSTLRH